MFRKKGTSLILSSCVLLSACATRVVYPDLKDVDISPTKTKAQLILEAAKMQTGYAATIDTLASQADNSALLNIVGGAALAAGGLYGAHKDTMTGIMLITGTNSVSNTTFGPQAQMAIYESGYAAIGCMVAVARNLPDIPADQSFSDRAIAVRAFRFGPFNFPVLDKEASAEQQEAFYRNKVALDLSASNISSSLQKASQAFDAAAQINSGEIFSSNLNALDRAVRKKLRDVVNAKGSSDYRSDLLKQIQDGANSANAAKATGANLLAEQRQIQIFSSSIFQANTATSIATALDAAATFLSFDADLKKCSVSSGI